MRFITVQVIGLYRTCRACLKKRWVNSSTDTAQFGQVRSKINGSAFKTIIYSINYYIKPICWRKHSRSGHKGCGRLYLHRYQKFSGFDVLDQMTDADYKRKNFSMEQV